ncbi:ribonuclease inhibitor [soil metagenome]
MQRVFFSFNTFKRSVVKYRFVLLIIAIAVLFLPLVQPTDGEASNLVYFLGRFHPLIVHFPVVQVFLALLFEILRKFKLINISGAAIGIILGIGLIGSLISLGMGFMLYYTGEYVGDIIQQHLWGGVILTASMALACFLFLSYYKSGSATVFTSYFSILIFTNVVLIYTSHQGGSLTHGSEYLTEYLPKFNNSQENWEPKPVEEMLVFEDMIVPFLDKKCMSCHNDNKSKGNLILTSYEEILKGGKSIHPTLKPGEPEDSEILQRAILPDDDDNKMPPEGKVPLTREEVALLEWWIEKGAETSLKVEEAALDQKVQPFIAAYLTDLENQQRARFMQKKDLENMISTVSTGNRFNLRLDPYGDGKIALSMAFPPTSFEDNDLQSLQAILPQISKASLVSSNITDDAFYHIGQMNSLRELYLQQTKITGSGLIYLSNLSNLQLLDLSKTEVTDGNLLHVLRISTLEDLYLNITNVSKEVVEAIKQNRPDLNVHLERGNFF